VNKKDFQKELWKVGHTWLSLLGNKVNLNFCKAEITTHPNYPSIVSLVDFIESGNMNYSVAKCNLSQINNLSYPLLAHINRIDDNFLLIIKDVSCWTKIEDSLNDWSGVVICPGQIKVWNNKEHLKYQKNISEQKRLFSVLGITSSLFYFGTLFFSNSFLLILFSLLSYVGILLSIHQVSISIGFQSNLLTKVCTVLGNKDCQETIKDKNVIRFWGITPAEASLIYFLTQSSIYLLSSYAHFSFTTVLLLTFPTSLTTIWSIYTQTFVLQSWCLLCLGTVLLLILQLIISINILTTEAIDYSFMLSFNSSLAFGLFLFSLIYLLFSQIVLPIKHIIKTNIENTFKIIELKKWKLDIRLFLTLWQQEKQLDVRFWDNEVVIGNPNGVVLITIVSSPFCRPCSNAHKLIENILHVFDKSVGVQVRFSLGSIDDKNKKYIAVKYLLQKWHELKNTIHSRRMLSDWFELQDIMTCDSRWNIKNIVDIDKEIQLHHNWAQQNHIIYTPTILLNGKKIPEIYSFQDFEILLPQLIKTFKENQR